MGSRWRARNMMRGSFLLLLHAISLFGASLLDEMEVVAPDCRTKTKKKKNCSPLHSPLPPSQLSFLGRKEKRFPRAGLRSGLRLIAPILLAGLQGGGFLTKISSLGGTSVISSPRVLSAP